VSEPIKVGDLVMVVRGHSCFMDFYGGIPFVVDGLLAPYGGGHMCKLCGMLNAGPNEVAATGLSYKGKRDVRAPVSWLKRIDPLAEPEHVETNESIPA
jgi:hypothetical protein